MTDLPTDMPSAPIHAVVRPPESMTQSAQVARVLWLRTLFGDAIPKAEEDGQPIEPLAHRMTEFFIPRGATLYEEGTSSDSLFFIVEGSVRQGQRGYTLFVPGDVLGFIDAMIDRPHRFSAIVEEDAVVLRLRIDDWLEYLEDHFDALRGVIESSLKTWGARPESRAVKSELLQTLLQVDGQHSSPSGMFVRRLLAVRSCPLLHRASIQALSQLVRSGTPRLLAEGQRCEKTQEPGIWIVIQGQVTLSTTDQDGHPTTVSYRPGSLLDSPVTLFDIPDVFEVTADTDSELLYMSSRDLFDIMEDHFDVALSTLSFMAVRVDELNQERTDAASTEELGSRGKRTLRAGR